jgi:hypothetical protein
MVVRVLAGDITRAWKRLRTLLGADDSIPAAILIEAACDVMETREKTEKTMKREDCVERCGGEELLFADGYDDCIIGVSMRKGVHIVVYDETKVVMKLANGGMTLEEAYEFFAFNIEGAWVGEQSPIFVDCMHDVENEDSEQ